MKSLRFSLYPRDEYKTKREYGHVLVVASSRGMHGSGVLACVSAQRSGCGLVTWALPKSLQVAAQKKVVEIMLILLPENRQGSIAASGAQTILNYHQRRKYDALLIGPGLTTHQDSAKLIKKILSSIDIPFVVDADALNLIAADKKLFGLLPKTCVMTPHEGEFERLFGEKPPVSIQRRIERVRFFAKKYSVVVVLKSSRTVVSDGRSVYVCNAPNSALAKAGSGDVLAGIIASFLAQKADAFEAACFGVKFHSVAARDARAHFGSFSMTPWDLGVYLAKALKNKPPLLHLVS